LKSSSVIKEGTEELKLKPLVLVQRFSAIPRKHCGANAVARGKKWTLSPISKNLILYGIFINFHVIELPRKVKIAISGKYFFFAEFIIGKIIEKLHVA